MKIRKVKFIDAKNQIKLSFIFFPLFKIQDVQEIVYTLYINCVKIKMRNVKQNDTKTRLNYLSYFFLLFKILDAQGIVYYVHTI